MTDGIHYCVETGVARIILDRKDKRNAVTAAMWATLPRLVRMADADEAAKAIVISGAGGHFAAGADISEFETVYATPERAAAYTRTMLDALAILETSAKPSVAAIEGACVGGGASIALACDFRIADDTAKLGITPGKLGLVYSADDTRRLASAVGVGAAKRLLMTAAIIPAAESLRIGLVDQVAPAGDLDEAVLALTNEMAARSQWSVRATKRMFRLLSPTDETAALGLMLEAFSGDDFREGYRAFLEKRPPAFPTK